MARLTQEDLDAKIRPLLQPGETFRHAAYGVKQPNLLLIILLIALAVIPGVIAVAILTKYFVIGLTNRRLIVLRVGASRKLDIQEVSEYGLDALRGLQIKTSTGAIFTHIRIDGPPKRFVAKFHRAFSKTNRENAIAIAQALEGAAA